MVAHFSSTCVFEEDVGDNIYNCVTRKDENPFAETKNETEQKKKDTWLEDVKEPCPDGQLQPGKVYRRCLGNRPDLCIRKFLLTLLKTATVVPLCI